MEILSFQYKDNLFFRAARYCQRTGQYFTRVLDKLTA